ncbi:MAG TPA: DUF2207 domain-containing protein [Streptosporangiaceae bacterium]|nr:DUF2207 domain-containing protein [Streptosporangiaceae bacterium]
MGARFARLMGIAGLSIPVVLLGLIPMAQAAQASSTSRAGGAARAGAATRASGADRDGGGERVTSYQISVTIRPDDVTHVREVIGYDFGASRRHGIYRYIPDRQPAGDGHVREYPVSHVTVSSPDGTPSQTLVTPGDANVMVRIGDPARTVTGQHTYVISYDIARAITTTAGHERLRLNLVGTGWTVPIAHVAATVSAPGAVTSAACYAGATGSRNDCESSAASGRQARFTQAVLAPGQGMTVTVALPAGSVRALPPLLVSTGGRLQRFGPLAGLVLAIVVVALLFTWPLLLAAALRRRAAAVTLPPGFAVDVRPGDGLGPARVLRPAEAGAVLSRGARPRHIAATVVDLAIRGYLRIEDVSRAGDAAGLTDGDELTARALTSEGSDAADLAVLSPVDWRLIRLKRIPAGTASTAGSRSRLLPYEETLLRELFRGRDQVRVSELHGTFWDSMTRVAAALAWHLQREGRLRLKMSQLRSWNISCWVVAVIGAGVAAAGFTLHQPPGAEFSGLVLGGAALLALITTARMRREPYQLSTRGMRLVAQLRPLRDEVAAKQPAAASADSWTEFTDLLPYAIALDEAASWAERFDGLAAPVQAAPWLESSVTGPGPLPGWYFTTFSYQVCGLAPPAHLLRAGAGWAPAGVASPFTRAGANGWAGGFGGGGFGGSGVGGGAGGGGGGSW